MKLCSQLYFTSLTLTTAMLAFTACQPKTVNQYTVAPSDATTSAQGTGTNNVTTRTADGTVDGGGGKGVVCKDPSTGKETVEVLDLYEGHLIYGFKPKDFGHATELQIMAQIVKKYQDRYLDQSSFPTIYPRTDSDSNDASNQEDIKKITNSKDLIDYVEKYVSVDVTMVDENTTLKDTQDSLEPFVSKNCQVIQIAVYYNEDRLLISQKYYDRLSPISRAALFLHEVLYKEERLNGANDSKTVRKFVAATLAADVDLKPIRFRNSPPTDDFLECYIENDSALGQSGIFYLYDEIDPTQPSAKTLAIQLFYVPGYSSLFRRTGLFSEISSILRFKNVGQTNSRNLQATTEKQTVQVKDFYEELSKNRIKLAPLTIEFNPSGRHRLINYQINETSKVDAVFTCSSANSERERFKKQATTTTTRVETSSSTPAK